MDDGMIEHAVLRTESLEEKTGAGHFIVEKHALIGEPWCRTQYGHSRVALEVDAAQVFDEVENLNLGEPFPPVRAIEWIKRPNQISVPLARRPASEVVRLHVDNKLVAAE
jgi:hypothetical protein